MDAYENHPFELVVNLLPVLCYKNPSVVVKPRTVFGSPEDSVVLQGVMKQWVSDIEFARVVREALYEFCFCFGVIGIGLETIPGHEEEVPAPMRPIIRQIPAGRFFADSEAIGFSSAAFMGHVWVKEIEEIKGAMDANGRPLFDAAAVAEVAGDEGMQADAQDTLRADIFSDIEVRKGQMVGYEVWCRSNNMIYTLAFKRNGRDGRFIREPREWVGSRTQGPYHMLGAYTVPNQLYPLSPLQVTADSVDEINAHAAMLKRQAGTAKRLIVVDATTTADKITTTPDGSVIVVPGFQKSDKLEFEGPNPANVEYLQFLRERLDRLSGISDMVRGNATGDPTATEAQLASQYHNGRVRFLQSIVQEACCALLANVAAVMYNSDEVAIPVSQGPVQGVFGGGAGPMGKREHLSVTIEPFSMEYVNEGLRQRQTMDTMRMVYELAPIMPTTPWVKHQAPWNDLLEAINVPEGFNRYFDGATLAMGMQMSAIQNVQQSVAETDATRAKAEAIRNPPPKPGGKPEPKPVKGSKGSEQGMRTAANRP